MPRLLLLLAVSLIALAGCQKKEEAAAADGLFGRPSGRYVGLGHFAPGRLWSQLASAKSPQDPATAQLDDDEEIIAVLDSRIGEVRQCGNLSGYCISMNPWAARAEQVPSAPVALAKHAKQLDEEAAAQADADAKRAAAR